jgi:ketosteroid isomerase-like protein
MNPSAEIRDAVLRFYQAVGAGDGAALERLFSRQGGVLAVGSDPSEWWSGYDTIVQAFEPQFRETGIRQVTPANLSAFVEGTVGWAADRRTMRLASGKEITIRETMLFHQEDGEWKLVQFHASVAVPNAELAG